MDSTNVFRDIDPKTAKRWLLVPGDWRRPGVEEEYEILWDTTRRFGQVWPRPGPSEVSSFYDVENYYTHGGGEKLPHQAQSFSQRLQTKIAWLGDKGIEPGAEWWSGILDDRTLHILEIGCGNGANLGMLAALGHSVVGVEPDPAAAAVARRAGHHVYDGTAESLPPELSAESFDVVIFMHVLEHCIDPFGAIRNAVGVLRNDGLVVAEVPNNGCEGARRFGVMWHWLDTPRHLNFFTAQSLADLFRSAGLGVQDVSFRGFCRQFSSSWKNAQGEIATRLGVNADKRPGELDYWRYLGATLWSEDTKKYDSVRIVGRYRHTAHDIRQ